VPDLPFFLAKKEVFEWLTQGKKTIDVRKGDSKPGEIAVFQSGPHALRLKIVKTESGRLTEVLRSDNFKQVIPSAVALGDAVDYLRGLYGGVYDGVFTAYYVVPLVVSEKS
jgi:ASC-1-like (ASCH) protein